MSKEYPLDGLALEIKAHWAKYRPKIYRQLEQEQEGKLDQSLHQASERTGQAFAQLVENGLEPPSAWERRGRTGPSCRRRATSRAR